MDQSHVRKVVVMIGNETELAGWQSLEEMIPKEILCSLFEASASGLSIFDWRVDKRLAHKRKMKSKIRKRTQGLADISIRCVSPGFAEEARGYDPLARSGERLRGRRTKSMLPGQNPERLRGPSRMALRQR